MIGFEEFVYFSSRYTLQDFAQFYKTLFPSLAYADLL